VINFRYHIVSLASVFLALAVGIVLGAHYFDNGTLGGDAGGSNDPGVVSFQSGYADLTAGPLLSGSLKGVGVVLFTLPGAEEKQVRDISANIAKAGGRVTGEVSFTSKLLDAGNRQFAESVAEGVLPNAPGSGYDKVGAALAAAFVGSGELDPKAGPIRSAFTEGGLIRVSTAPKTRAPLVLIVAGSATDQSNSGAVVADLAATLAEAGNGAVIAGPSTASTGDELLAAVRDSSSAGDFGTVDVTDTAAGRVIVVLALRSVSEGSTGSWGTSRSHDGAIPGE
jgi:hypothetical protein